MDSMRFLTGSNAAVNTAVVNWEMRWLSPTAVSTPSLISLCCNSMNSAGLFTLSRRSTRQPALNRLSMSSFGYGRALVFTPFETTC
jgi:hypothetical protein